MHLNLVRFRFGETIESVQWPLNAQLGLGTGGGSAGFGYGFAGGPDGPMKGPVQPFGFGVRLQIFKPWNVLTGRSDFIDYTKIYMGIDTTVTFLFLGVDVGYLIPQNFKTEKSFLSLGIGVGF